MNLRDIGEFGLIQREARRLKRRRGVVVGPGDDCAAVRLDARRYQLLTCDMLVEGLDFTRRDDPRLVGRKAVAVCVSDIASCAGRPAYALVSVGMPPSTSVAYADALFEGMRDIAGRFGAAIVGGDVSRSNKIVIDVSMTGVVEKKKLVLRRGARLGDLIFVTGPLGGSRAGRHLTFTPRVRQARYLAEHFRVHAMIDISDGLAQDLGHILRASGTGAVLFERLIPVHRDAAGLRGALYDGEDFELIAVLSRASGQALLKRAPRDFFLIGEIMPRARGLTIIDKQCRERPVTPGGFRHF